MIKQDSPQATEGTRFGRLTVLGWQFRIGQWAHAVVRCDCGNVLVMGISRMVGGNTRSCGCLHRERAATIHLLRNPANQYRTHGMSHTRLHRIWRSLKQRCYNPNNGSYQWYGAKGVTVCAEWLESFAAFAEWSLANGYSDTLTIDRRRAADPYSPSTCRWVTREVNSAMAKWVHGQQASTVIPADVETDFDKTLKPGRGGKRHPDNCPPIRHNP